MRLHLILSLLLSIAATGTKLAAQWNTNPLQANTRVVTASGSQDKVQVVANGLGGCIVVWEDYRGGNYPDIYFDLMDANGNTAWSVANSFAGVKLCTTNKARTINRILPNNSGGFFIIWDELNGLYYDVVAQNISSGGLPQWGANGVVVCAAANDQYSADIAPDGSGGIIATWLDLRNDPLNAESFQTFAQRISAAGTAAWSANGVLVSNTISKPIGIVSDKNGGAIIGFMDTRNSSVNGSGAYINFDIFAQRINTNGTPQWAANGVAVCTQTGNQVRETIRPGGAMVSDDLEGAILCWSDYRNDPNNGLSSPYRAGYFAQHIDLNGTPLWTAGGTQICTGTNADLYNTMAVPDGEGGLLAAWYDLRSSPQSAIYVQRIDDSGNKLYANNGQAMVTGQNHIVNYDMAPDGKGDAVIAYDNDTDDIYSYRFLLATGTPVNGGNNPICTRAEASVSPALAADQNGDLYFAWQDYRNNVAETDIYAMKQTSGSLLPMHFISFNGFGQHGNNYLQWKTTPLEGSQQFFIFRSNDGMHFEKLAAVNRKHTDAIHTYTDSIAHKTKTNYYRIGWKNEQGNFGYSNTISLRQNSAVTLAKMITPNPTHNAAQLTLQSETDSKATITLYTATMQPVWKKDATIKAGINSISISLQAVSSGIYFLAISSAQGTEVLKGIKQ